MQKIKVMSLICILLFSVGCATKNGRGKGSNNLSKLQDVKTVAVSTFTCSDPLIAQNITNKVVEILLSDYSVVLGTQADVLISGAVNLRKDNNAIVSEVRAKIMKDQEVVTSISVTQDETNSNTIESPESMGKKIGVKISDILSRK